MLALAFAITYVFYYISRVSIHILLVTSELLFELYSVPSLTYCVDSIMSFYHNKLPSPPVPFTSDGIIVSFNAASSSVIPILNGKGLTSHAKRYDLFKEESTQYTMGCYSS